ncbi:sugar ABC transporter substrate-binding protein [Hydrogenoanaerobacterium sp.]|uniref:ABC transporter substrate-binding protein n=1 Tax=Hydrogenoanaerobacterium sp. TaxID=2953763 RepID=UPI00289BF782|nr:sugar ABC transporter substrate-binding protein [Hydrogenoanaerobacterium sp.]
MKRVLRIITAFALCLTMLAGCGTPPAPSGDGSSSTASSLPASTQKTDLLLWMPPFGTGDSLDMEFWTKALEPWATENNVNLSIEITPWGGYEEKYLTGFSSGEGPDVGYMYLEMFNDFIEMGALADISGQFTPEEKDNYIYWEKGNMKGGQYALPFVVGNARIPYFNMDILNKVGVTEPPKTWAELVDVTLKIKQQLPDVIPFAQEWADPAIGALNNVYYPYLWQAGGDIYSADGSSVALMNNTAAVEAAQFLYDLKFKHGVLTDESLALSGDAVREQFCAGRVAIASMDAKSSTQLDKAGINWDFLNSFEGKTKATWVASDSLIMNNASKNKELAASLMKYITSAPVMTAFHKEIASFPPITKDEEYNDNPKFKDMYENQSEFFHTLPVANGAFKVMDTLYKNLQLMMLGDLTPEQAIQKTVDYSKSIG